MGRMVGSDIILPMIFGIGSSRPQPQVPIVLWSGSQRARQERHSMSTSPKPVSNALHQQPSKMLRPLDSPMVDICTLYFHSIVTSHNNLRNSLFVSKEHFRVYSRKLNMRLYIDPKEERSAKWRSTTRQRTVILIRLITVCGRQIAIYHRNAAFGLSSTTCATSLKYALNHPLRSGTHGGKPKIRNLFRYLAAADPT